MSSHRHEQFLKFTHNVGSHVLWAWSEGCAWHDAGAAVPAKRLEHLWSTVSGRKDDANKARVPPESGGPGGSMR